jgi:uncharacterized membrane protein
MLQGIFKAIGYGLCHQLPERSLFVGGLQLPVCARDTGIYLGFALGLVVVALLDRGRRSRELPRWPVLALAGLFVLSMAIDGLTSYGGLRETTNAIRLATGLATGWALAPLTVMMINEQLWAQGARTRIIEGARATALWIGGLPASFGLAWTVLPLTGVLYPIIVSVAIIATFMAVNLVLVGLVPRFEKRAKRFRDAVPQLAIALALTAGELAAAAWLRVIAEGASRATVG